jgi:hypothetical protein
MFYVEDSYYINLSGGQRRDDSGMDIDIVEKL